VLLLGDPLIKRYVLPEVPTPIDPEDIANKVYVDDKAAQTFARVVKKVDQTKNSDTTLADDDELVIALNANKAYGYYFPFFFNSGAIPDIKFLLSIPAGATALLMDILRGDTLTPVRNPSISRTFATTGVDQGIVYAGRIIVAGTPGNVALQWAQANSDAGDTKVLRGSHLVIWEELV